MCEKAAGEKLACQMKMEKLAPLPLTLPLRSPTPKFCFVLTITRPGSEFYPAPGTLANYYYHCYYRHHQKASGVAQQFLRQFLPPSTPLSTLFLLCCSCSHSHRVLCFFVFLYFCAISSRVCVHSGRFFFFFAVQTLVGKQPEVQFCPSCRRHWLWLCSVTKSGEVNLHHYNHHHHRHQPHHWTSPLLVSLSQMCWNWIENRKNYSGFPLFFFLVVVLSMSNALCAASNRKSAHSYMMGKHCCHSGLVFWCFG